MQHSCPERGERRFGFSISARTVLEGICLREPQGKAYPIALTRVWGIKANADRPRNARQFPNDRDLRSSAYIHLFHARGSQSYVDKTAISDAIVTPVSTAVPAFSIAGVFGALAFSYVRLVKLFPKSVSRTDGVMFM
jgi:hypothetical protein